VPYRGFAQLEYDHARRSIYPSFDWTTFAEPSPRRRLDAPVAHARVALVATAGVHLPEQPPFDLGDAGDSSFREIPADAAQLCLAHAGYNTRRAQEDPDVVFPLVLLRRLAMEGVVGTVASRAFSFMGYIPETGPLLEETGPAVARKLLYDGADLVLLVPS